MKKKLFLGAIWLLLIGGCIGAVWLRHVLWGTISSRDVELEIAPGTPARAILSRLQNEGILPSPTAARIYLRFRAQERSLHFGRYHFPEGSRPVEVLERVLDGRVEMFSVRIVEGQNAAAISGLFEDMDLGTESEWKALLKRVDWISDLAPKANSLEGFLFPDTYRFAVGIPAEEAAKHLTQKFRAVWSEEIGSQETLWGTCLEIVTLASLVEAETSVPAERARIAGVFLNRLRRGMLLQCDPTVIFALQRRHEWRGRLWGKDLVVDDPYNTYKYPGLPPGPINSPGRAALAGAINPEETPYLYFVARPGGGHTFSSTLAEHNRAVAELRRARR